MPGLLVDLAIRINNPESEAGSKAPTVDGSQRSAAEHQRGNKALSGNDWQDVLGFLPGDALIEADGEPIMQVFLNLLLTALPARKTHAAALLGISARTLWYKLRKIRD